MPKDEDQNAERNSGAGTLNKFLPGGELGPVTDRRQYEERLKTLPPEQREFAEESARFAELWQYFSQHRMQLPQDLVNQVAELSKLTTAQQTTVLRRVNQQLMEYLNDVSEDSGVRQ